MTDSRKKTILEVCSGKLVSFVIGFYLNYLLFQAFGIQGNIEIYSTISGVMVLIATFRSYFWRRLWNRVNVFEENGVHFGQ